MRAGGTIIQVLFSLAVFLLVPLAAAFAQQGIAVIVVDVQGDFTTWKNGTLAVPGTDEGYVRGVEAATRQLKQAGFEVYATQDWHPANHVSFFPSHPGKKAFDVITIDGRTQVLWPPHCVQNTDGAKVLLDGSLFKAVVRKGQDPRYDSYSGFKDDGGASTEMDALLKKAGVKKVVVYGIATDYCVKATALDAAALGYKVAVVAGLSRGVAPGTSQEAIAEMQKKGILVTDDLDLEKIKGL